MDLKLLYKAIVGAVFFFFDGFKDFDHVVKFLTF